MEIALKLRPCPDRTWVIARQMGITVAVTAIPLGEYIPMFRHEKPWKFEPLLRLKSAFRDAGMDLSVLEGNLPLDKTKLGLPGRDAEIQLFCELLRNMGKVGIPILSYAFMAKFGWLRTSTTTVTRGGALTTSFDYNLVKDAPLTEAGEVSEEEMWDNFAYFLHNVVPCAEKAGVKLALHPDDPPVARLRGLARIFRSVDAFKRAIQLEPSEYSGINFCQGNFSAMGCDIQNTIHDFGHTGKIFYAHFRDIRGNAQKFCETFHDDGQTNMFMAMKAYKEAGFRGPIRPDHAPTMEGEENVNPGYETLGRLFAVGYMKGLMEALKVS